MVYRFFRFFLPLLLAAISPVGVQSQTVVSPPLTAGSTAGWYTDRYDPASFAVNNGVHGRNDVLQIGIDRTTDLANRPGPFQSSFYNTQGKKFDVLTSGSWSFQMDLFVENSWANSANGYVRTDMWATGIDMANAVSAYGIVGFTNYGGGARFRGWDSNLGTWTDGGTVNFGAWNTLSMMFDVNTHTYTYSANGTQISSFVDMSSVGVHDVMMQTYNFNDPALNVSGNAAYTANWSNTSTVPEPSTYALMAAGLAALGVISRRRRAVPVLS